MFTSFFIIIFSAIIIDFEKNSKYFSLLIMYGQFQVYRRKNNVLYDFYSKAKSEILGYEDYLKLDTTEQ